jgi:hypothetical protein
MSTEQNYIGTIVAREDGVTGKIIEQKANGRFQVMWADGETDACGFGMIRATLPKPVAAPVATDGSIRAIVDQQAIAANAGAGLRECARIALADLDAVRAGRPPSPMTADDQARILARVNAAKPVALTDADRLAVERAMTGGKPARSYRETVATEVARLTK